MEKLTLQQSTIHGTVHGQRVMSTVRASPAGLILPRGQYLLHPPVDNPVYGQVMAIEPLPASVLPAGEIYIKGIPARHIVKTPPANLKDAPGAIKDTQMRAPTWAKMGSPASKVDSPAMKFLSPASKVDSPAMKFSPASKVDSPAMKFLSPASKVDSPAMKFLSPASKVDSPSMQTSKVDSPSIKFDGPSMKWATGPGSADQPVVITSRAIAGNGFVVTSGLGDLFDAVRLAGGVILVAE